MKKGEGGEGGKKEDPNFSFNKNLKKKRSVSFLQGEGGKGEEASPIPRLRERGESCFPTLHFRRNLKAEGRGP